MLALCRCMSLSMLSDMRVVIINTVAGFESKTCKGEFAVKTPLCSCSHMVNGSRITGREFYAGFHFLTRFFLCQSTLGGIMPSVLKLEILVH